MKTKNLFAALMFVLLSATSVFAQTTKKPLTIKSADNGKTITVKKAKSFNVVFENECVGCRYIWTLTNFDENIVSKPTESHDNSSCKDCVGGNQDHTFTFKALKAGKTKLNFDYGDQHFSVTIVVK